MSTSTNMNDDGIFISPYYTKHFTMLAKHFIRYFEVYLF